MCLSRLKPTKLTKLGIGWKILDKRCRTSFSGKSYKADEWYVAKVGNDLWTDSDNIKYPQGFHILLKKPALSEYGLQSYQTFPVMFDTIIVEGMDTTQDWLMEDYKFNGIPTVVAKRMRFLTQLEIDALGLGVKLPDEFKGVTRVPTVKKVAPVKKTITKRGRKK